MKAVAFELLTSWIPEDLHLLLNPHSTDAFGIMEIHLFVKLGFFGSFY